MKRLIELDSKSKRVTDLAELCQKKFSFAASQNNKEMMESARNEYHAVMDETLDLIYDVAQLRVEMEKKILGKLK